MSEQRYPEQARDYAEDADQAPMHDTRLAVLVATVGVATLGVLLSLAAWVWVNWWFLVRVFGG